MYNEKNCNNNQKEYSSLDKINYYIYKDNDFLRSIYSQIFISTPDLGIIEYKGTNTHLYTKEIRGFGEEENETLLKYLEENAGANKDEIIEKNKDKILSELRFSDTDGINIMREYANIDEIKRLNIEALYKNYIKEINNKSNKNDNNIININGSIEPYSTDEYLKKFNKDPEDLFIKVNEDCVWLKHSLLDTDINIVANIFEKVNIIGYIISKKTKGYPRIIKAIVIYI